MNHYNSFIECIPSIDADEHAGTVVCTDCHSGLVLCPRHMKRVTHGPAVGNKKIF